MHDVTVGILDVLGGTFTTDLPLLSSNGFKAFMEVAMTPF